MDLAEKNMYGYNDVISEELNLLKKIDNERCIPSVIDGFKSGQREVLFTCIKRKDKAEVCVTDLAGSVISNSMYSLSESSVAKKVIHLAQNFVGSNNVNLLQPIGQFGTRLQGGKDAADPRQLYTMPSPIVKHLFPSQDDSLLDYLYNNNQKCQPTYYVPIIPMVLVNGAEGFSADYNTKVPCYNPRDIVQNIYRMLNGEELIEMLPWYKNFRGTVNKINQQHFITSGEINKLNHNTIEIIELPIGVWTDTYKQTILHSMGNSSNKQSPFIIDYKSYFTDTSVKFVITLAPEKIQEIEKLGFHKVLKLQSSISTCSMVLFDQNGDLKRYNSALDILKEFYKVRYHLYERRKQYLCNLRISEIRKLNNKIRFISEMCSKKIILDPDLEDVTQLLHKQGYDPDPEKAFQQNEENVKRSQTDDSSDSEDEIPTSGPDYSYLLNMPMWSLSLESQETLLKKLNEKKKEIEELENKSISALWKEELQAFLNKLDEIEGKEKKYELSESSSFCERIVPNVDVELCKKCQTKSR